VYSIKKAPVTGAFFIEHMGDEVISTEKAGETGKAGAEYLCGKSFLLYAR
jgi:hypothetical protein